MVNLENSESEPTENWVEYKFSGSCENTIMTLNYKSESGNIVKREKYKFFSDKVSEEACSFE
jgi:hypothetical protein